jgi:hypothetical protein
LSSSLPLVLAGPILRKTTLAKFYLWLSTSTNVEISPSVYLEQGVIETKSNVQSLQLGEHAWVHLIAISADTDLPSDQIIEYDLTIKPLNENTISSKEDGSPSKEDGSPLKEDIRPSKISQLCPYLLYPGKERLSFTIAKNLSNVLHGSCRKPHHPSQDCLPVVDTLIQDNIDHATFRPHMLLMTGDQVYCDDVAGPMLQALNQVSDLLGLYEESFTDTVLTSSADIFNDPNCYYQRQSWLPIVEHQVGWRKKLVSIFTSRFCHNHLVSYKEVMAQYLLTWSPTLWQMVEFDSTTVPKIHQANFEQEAAHITEFVQGLARVQRLLAHVPTYMIFDDHDITDDWNLTAAWETLSQNHPFSRQIIGNALLGYFIFQGWGNNPEQFNEDWLKNITSYQQEPSQANQQAAHTQLIDEEDWHYVIDTYPKTVVLNTRTRRWWSESNRNNPSGLLDWEGLAELQQELKDQKSVILVSPAPIFGVKFIETVQRVFTFLGAPLAVDAENWMAHPGSASSILNIFKSRKTPEHFIILSGDVHYSFVYDIELSFRQNSPKIWQITCSGLKNEFPEPLITWLGRINRWLYAKHSPLNWFTKRRRMLISQRNHSGCQYRKLWNKSGIGYVEISKDGSAENISVLDAKNNKVTFK